MTDKRIGLALTGSFCNFDRAYDAARRLVSLGARLVPMMSFNAAAIDTRFGRAAEWRGRFEILCGREVIDTIEGAEPLGPQNICDVLVIAPCTGNTLAKIACGINDTPVTMAAKSLLRNGKPVVLAPFTNDGMSSSAKNIGELLNRKNVYFVPMYQDDADAKPRSLASDLTKLPETIELALSAAQIMPLIS